jgi:hypothetical protein
MIFTNAGVVLTVVVIKLLKNFGLYDCCFLLVVYHLLLRDFEPYGIMFMVCVHVCVCVVVVVVTITHGYAVQAFGR